MLQLLNVSLQPSKQREHTESPLNNWKLFHLSKQEGPKPAALVVLNKADVMQPPQYITEVELGPIWVLGGIVG